MRLLQWTGDQFRSKLRFTFTVNSENPFARARKENADTVSEVRFK